MFSLLIFLGSFLLFLIQPMLGRTLLPMFGGSAAVWCICLAAYQTLLLAGYFYAHRLTERGRFLETGVRVPPLFLHAGLLFVAALWTIGASEARPWFAAHVGHSSWPVAESLGCVLAIAGIPYVLLSAGSTLTQAAASVLRRTAPARSVYRLYAVSNVGSLLGLLVYPFLLEPHVGLTAQWRIFGAGCTVYAGLFTAVAFRLSRAMLSGTVCEKGKDTPPSPDEEISSRSDPSSFLWFFLPGLLSFLLNAVVAHLFIDVTPLPLVWDMMLSAFLLSYIVGFSKFGERCSRAWSALALVSLVAAIFATRLWGTGSFYPNAGAALAVLFFCGTCLTEWLCSTRPPEARLTRFYLFTAAGGAAGGLLASFVAPPLFARVQEYPLSLLVCAACCTYRLFPRTSDARKFAPMRLVPAFAGAGVALVCILLARHPSDARQLFRTRNFYGSLGITQTLERIGQNPVLVSYLWYGQTTHGLQVRSNEFRREPLAYYAPFSAGTAVLSHPKWKSNERMNVGIIGLGAGILASYGRPQDLYRFFEINPQVMDVAKNPQYFTYLSDAACDIDLVLGDARTLLAQEVQAGDPQYDVLYVDAYSGDAVPYHLTTREAFSLYLERLAPNGILAIHISNWHIDLLPLCKSAAEALGLFTYGIQTAGDGRLVSGTVWVFLSRYPTAYLPPESGKVSPIDWESIRSFPVPTDEKGSLLPLLRM